LKSINNSWYYIGSTKNLKKRFKEHNSGMSKSAKFYKPFELVYYEDYPCYSLARKREIDLKKNGQQKEILFKKLEVD
jgi:putative endonuclease